MAINLDYDEEPREQYIARAKAMGFEILIPKANELFIDIDSMDDWEWFSNNFASLSSFIVTKYPEWDILSAISDTESKSGEGHRHIIVTLPFDMDDWQRIAMQAVLGSDRKRELLSCGRVISGNLPATLFAEKTDVTC